MTSLSIDELQFLAVAIGQFMDAGHARKKKAAKSS
jgi:hypothetical protein